MFERNTVNLPNLRISVVICAYTQARWHELGAAVASLRRQTLAPLEVIVVIDHNSALLERAHMTFSGAIVVDNYQQRGLSGARNSGIEVAQGAVIAFLDDDAVAAADWLEQLAAGYDTPNVIGVGGAIEPQWDAEKPRWFPEEFNWVVGCSYRGMPETTTGVRNLIGCNMSFRREVFDAVGHFRSGIGRVDTIPVGCEETEFCIRVRQRWPQRILLYKPQARVYHRVPATRGAWSYFWTRCYAEGISKALISRFIGSRDALASERTYTLRTLPQGVLRGLMDTFLRGSPCGLGRAAAIVAGLAVTTAGYMIGSSFKRRLRRHNTAPSTAAPGSAALHFEPRRLFEVELTQPFPTVDTFDSETSRHYRRAMSLARLHTQPIGLVELELNEHGLSAEGYSEQVWRDLRLQIAEHLRQDGLPEAATLDAMGLPSTGMPACLQERERFLAHAPFVSIVVATRDRPESLVASVHSLLNLNYPHYEIIVVDNAPSTTATADILRQMFSDEPRVRYVREDWPGLSSAHNRGLMETQADIVAFTDDDVLVDQYWLAELVKAFRGDDQVACVTGMILPRQIETPAQLWIEQFGGFSKGFKRRVFNMAEHRVQTPLYPYTAGIFGSGANMAFKTAVLRKLGGFDPALGAGSQALGGDDLGAFFEIVNHGYTLVYEPAAFVYHAHREDYAGLKKQVYGYGVGLTAYLTKVVLDHPRLLLDVAARIPYGLVYTLSSHSPKNIKKGVDYPTELTRIERNGMLYGPLAYLRSRRQAKKLQQRLGSPSTRGSMKSYAD